ncbi:sensor domain-containing phosphodiesterase [Methyloversatilis thermotolerans]|uniref:sensor domain-containing phosphodiesterase n=1 Tax=Methyloversatilis thermotolerans TaxID=1346290 RepID=UPI000477DE3A|nr:EAL domain-containing protein [Methyloversatilis thermotolerans]
MAHAMLSAAAEADQRPGADIVHHAQGVLARYQGLTLTSHFQPIFSVSHCRAIGHEGLLRATDAEGTPVAPTRVISSPRSYEDLRYLDQLCRYLHVSNHAATAPSGGWLFLNIHPEVFRRGPDEDLSDFLPELTDHPEIDPRHIVIEVMEQAVSENEGFARTVEYLRGLGCMIALDDFGAGHSNFDRIWTLQPEIVKLDRSFATKSVEDPSARRLLPQIVSLIHEAGSLVLLEGVETEAQAVAALDADIDFIQGFYFAMPQARPVDTREMNVVLNTLWERFDLTRGHGAARYRELIAPYIHALGSSAVLMEEGAPMDDACRSFLDLERADCCFLLDAEGRQVGRNVRASSAHGRPDSQYRELSMNRHARWSRRPYFRRAIENVGKVQVTRPYLSISSGLLCVTVSIAYRAWNDELRVLCGDLHWPQVV